jgi:hypothetical protein
VVTENPAPLDSVGRLRNKALVTVGAPIVFGFGAYYIVFHYLQLHEYMAYAAALVIAFELLWKSRTIPFRPTDLQAVMFLTFSSLSYGVGGISAYAAYSLSQWVGRFIEVLRIYRRATMLAAEILGRTGTFNYWLMRLTEIDIAEYWPSGYDIVRWIPLALAFVVGAVVRGKVWSRAVGRQGPIELRKFISQSIALSLTTVAVWVIAYGVCLYTKDFQTWMNVTVSTLFSVGAFFIGTEVFYGFYEDSVSTLGGVEDETNESAQKKWDKFIKCDDRLVYLFGLKVPARFLRLNTFLIGLPGSGKSALTKRTYADVVPLVHEGLRAVMLDFKSELPAFFLAIGIEASSFIFMSPRDKRSRPHALWRDIRSIDDCNNFGMAVVPEDKEDRTKFFNASANQLFNDEMVALFLESLDRKDRGEGPLEYYWRDAVLFASSKDDLKELLLKHPQTSGSVAYLERDNDDCFTTLQTFVKKLSVPAALQDAARREGKEPISLTDWVEGKDGDKGSILHFGVDPRAEASSKVYNSFAISHIGMHILGQPDTHELKYFFGVDEAANVISCVPNLPTVASAGRSKGLAIWATIQDLSQWQYVTGEMLGKAIFSMFSHVACLKVRNSQTAKFMQELIGEVDERYHSESVSRLQLGPGGVTGNIQDQRRIRPAGYTSDLMHCESADPQSGVPGWFINSKTMPVKAILRDVFDGVPNLDLEDPEVKLNNSQPRDNPLDYVLKPWTPEEREHFGLKPRPESAKGDNSKSAKGDDNNRAKGDDSGAGSGKKNASGKKNLYDLATARKRNRAPRKSEPESEDITIDKLIESIRAQDAQDA